MTKTADSRESGASQWAVFRQDDNGNQYVVETGLSREEAEQLVTQYQSLGHKQLYWAEQEWK